MTAVTGALVIGLLAWASTPSDRPATINVLAGAPTGGVPEGGTGAGASTGTAVAPGTGGTSESATSGGTVATLAKAGLPNATQGTGLLSVACTNASLFAAAATNAPSLTGRQLATGLARSGRLELSYPAGPVEVTDSGLPTAGALARPAKWSTACQCWKVVDPRYRAY